MRINTFFDQYGIPRSFLTCFYLMTLRYRPSLTSFYSYCPPQDPALLVPAKPLPMLVVPVEVVVSSANPLASLSLTLIETLPLHNLLSHVDNREVTTSDDDPSLNVQAIQIVNVTCAYQGNHKVLPNVTADLSLPKR